LIGPDLSPSKYSIVWKFSLPTPTMMMLIGRLEAATMAALLIIVWLRYVTITSC
jgi:hypothetical protein